MRPRIRSTTRPALTLVLAAALAVTTATTALALINPNFSPVHLAQQSDVIMVLKFEGAPAEGKAKATVSEVLKGKAPAQTFTFDLFAGAFEEQGKAVAKMIADGTREALFFVGFFEDAEGEGGGMPQQEAKGMLHIGGQWVTMLSAPENLWDMERISSRMLGTWAGSTDMLLKALKYILSDDTADVPVRTNAEWDKPVLITRLDGKVNTVRAVDLEGGRLSLFVGCEGGDRLFTFKDGKFVEGRALKSKSKASAWTDGVLVSWDGSVLSQDGTPLTKPGALADGCTSLAVVRVDARRKLIVIGTSASPQVLALTADGVGVPARLVEGDFPAKNFGPGGGCLVVDFDGDGTCDIVQLFEGGGLFYKGKPGGEFDAPAVTRIALGKGHSTAQLGDYDADGLPDVLTSAEDANRIWHNLGQGQFVEMLSQSGEIAYISKPGGVDGMTGDINNDGRQDVLIAYAAAPPQVFFNRGFRSFGHSRELDLGDLKLVEPAKDGQQAACLADLNGDGAQDMVIALKNGEVWFVPRRVLEATALSVSVALPAGKGFCEPVSVVAWSGKRCLGAWSVGSSGAPAFFGMREAGALTLKWRFPGGVEQTREVVVLDKPVRVELAPAKQ